VVVKTLPPTAGVRVWTFDGGGVRGLASLQYIQKLQDRIGLPYPVQKHFDVAFGTSIGKRAPEESSKLTYAGGIILSGLCIIGLPVELCIERLESMAKLAFKPRSSSGIPIISPIIDFLLSGIPIISPIIYFLVSVFADGRYPADNLDAALQDEFGRDRSILDCSKATAAGTRIGLPVTTVRDTSACVFTNYNGVGTRPPGSGRSLT
jgi:hypothetical protein